MELDTSAFKIYDFRGQSGIFVLLMKTIDIRQKLHRYIETAQDKKVKAIYAMVEEEIQETNSYWNNPEFLAELKRRDEEYLTGKSKTYTLEEALKKARSAVKKVARK